MKPSIRTKRIYEPPSHSDGYRVLIDRLWPRGFSIERALIDEWAKEIAPSTALRKSFGHMLDQWDVFQKEYKNELDHNAAVDEALDRWKDKHVITLLYAAKDEEHNHSLVLSKYLSDHWKKG